MTILLVPFIQCGAKIPVYSLFALVFFKQNAGIAIFMIYLAGIAFAFISAVLFKKFLFIGHTGEFVMELPSYHLPTWNGIFTHTWFKLKSFILRAGQTILLVMIFMTLVNSVPIYHNQQENKDETILTLSGKALTPLFKPMGIEKENWPATLALFTGFFAKEAIVGTLEAISISDKTAPVTEDKSDSFSLGRVISASFSDFKTEFGNSIHKFIHPLEIQVYSEAEYESHHLKRQFQTIHQVIAYLLFIMIYAPCMASVVAAKKEAGSKLAMFQLTYLTVLAWIVGSLYYQLSQVSQGISWMIVLPPVLFMGLIAMIRLYARETEKIG